MNFLRSPSGAVHVIGELRPEDVDPALRWKDSGLKPLNELTLAITSTLYRRTVCGRVVNVEFDISGWHVISPGFDDDDLCHSCYRALGERSIEVFEAQTEWDTEQSYRNWG